MPDKQRGESDEGTEEENHNFSETRRSVLKVIGAGAVAVIVDGSAL